MITLVAYTAEYQNQLLRCSEIQKKSSLKSCVKRYVLFLEERIEPELTSRSKKLNGYT